MATAATSLITYTKLRDGSWGLRGSGLVASRSVIVTKKSGETKTETVGRVLWTGQDGVSLATTGARERQSTGTAARTMPRDGQVYAGASGGVRHERGTNRRADACERCGEWCAVGAGRLEYCVEDSGCRVHHDEGGYHLYCADADACTARRTARRAAAAEAKARINQASAAWDAAMSRIQTKTDTRPAWAQTPAAQWHAPVMPHTGAYPAIYLGETDVYYEVPGYFACDWDYAPVRRVAELTEDLRTQIESAILAAREAGLLRAAN